MTEILVLPQADCLGEIYIGCVGFEHRSVEALRADKSSQAASCKLLYSYDTVGVNSFEANLREVGNLGCYVDACFEHFLDKLSLTFSSRARNSLIFDVTSFDRKKMARILELIFDMRHCIRDVTIIYYPRVYSPPPPGLEEVLHFGPVTPRFVGDVSYEREHLSLIVGAGYEFGRVVGAIDVLEPEHTYCFTPAGPDQRFEQSVMKNNLDFRFLDDPELLISYDVLRPDVLFFQLRRLLEVEMRERNVLILPLGPKIFAAISTVVALIYYPSVMVWRHSTVGARTSATFVDARASGSIARFSFGFANK